MFAIVARRVLNNYRIIFIQVACVWDGVPACPKLSRESSEQVLACSALGNFEPSKQRALFSWPPPHLHAGAMCMQYSAQIWRCFVCVVVLSSAVVWSRKGITTSCTEGETSFREDTSAIPTPPLSPMLSTVPDHSYHRGRLLSMSTQRRRRLVFVMIKMICFRIFQVKSWTNQG